MNDELRQTVRAGAVVELIKNEDKEKAQKILNECVRLGIETVAIKMGNELFSFIRKDYAMLKIVAICKPRLEDIIEASLLKADAVVLNTVDEELLKQCNEFGLMCYCTRSNEINCPILLNSHDNQLLKNEDVDAIMYEWEAEELSAVIDRLLDLRMVHIGINHKNEEEALKAARLFELLFHMPYKVGNSSIFSGNKELELMKTMGRGTNGHIAIGVSDIDRGMHYLAKRGCEFLNESLVCKDGNKIAIYLKDEISGFAVHLVKA